MAAAPPRLDQRNLHARPRQLVESDRLDHVRRLAGIVRRLHRRLAPPRPDDARVQHHAWARRAACCQRRRVGHVLLAHRHVLLLRAALAPTDKRLPTGGLHAAGLFDANGDLLALREDVGRHNAVDKVIGWAFLEDRLPLSETILMISGRGSFEIVQKAVAAGIPIVCAVSAPSSLAVDLALRFDQTLIGFLRGSRFNIYSSAKRVELVTAITSDKS